MANVVVVQERQAAQAFLRAIGANWQNNDLIYAVVAWMRQESGGIKSIIGNNPFNIRPTGSIDPNLIAGIRQSKNGNGLFLIFKSLAAGLTATAQLLLRAGHDWRNYDRIIRAFRQGSALDALTAIALSAWDSGHYGYHAGDPLGNNHLVQVYASFTGMQIPKPVPHNPKTPKPQHKPPLPPLPRDLAVPVIVRTYLHPYDARDFYRARRDKATNIISD